MNNDLGTVITVIVTDTNEKHAFGQKNGVTYQIRSEENYNIGDTVSGFAYINKADKLVVTTKLPKVTNEKYRFCEVVEVRKDLGAFVDIGLPDKDIAVSMDDLPELRHLWPRKGDHLYIKLTVDSKDRMWGQLADEDVFDSISHLGTSTQKNNNVEGTVYSLRKSGTYVYTKDSYTAFIHPSEREEEPRLGQEVSGRIVGVREDGVLYASLLQRSHEKLDGDAMMIYEVILRSPDKAIEYTDKSNPDDIKKYFGISKGQFKKAVGRLMKKGLVVQKDGETRLSEKE